MISFFSFNILNRRTNRTIKRSPVPKFDILREKIKFNNYAVANY